MNRKRYKHNCNAFYHSQAWKDVRRQVLDRDHYRCQVCKRAGRLTVADTVHHIVPVRVDWSKRLDPSNLEAICRECHNKEHTERAQSLKAKKTHLKAAKNKRVAHFNANPEIW